MVHAEPDQLLIVPCPVTDAGEVGHRFQQVGLALGVVAVDHIDIGVKGGVQMDVIPEKIQA